MTRKIEKIESKPELAPWTCTLIFSVIGTSCAVSLPSGYVLGVLNNPLLFVKEWCSSSIKERYDIILREDQLQMLISFIVTIYIVGGTLGAFTCSFLTERIGRRGTILCNSVILLIAAAGFFACRRLNSVELLLLSRFLAGYSAGQAAVCLPMYHNEIATVSQRGILGVCSSLGSTLGLVMSQVVSLRSILGDQDHWHLAFSFYALFTMVCLAAFRFYPESPKWLFIIKQRRNEAFAELLRLRGKNQINNIEAEIKAMEEEQNAVTHKSGYTEVIRNKRFCLPLSLMFSFMAGQQLSGINAVFYYSVSIFQKAGLSLQVCEWLNLGTGVVNMLGSAMGLWLMANLKRRTMLLNSAFFCGVFILLFGIMMAYMSEVPWFAQGCIVSIFLYIIAFQVGLGPLPGYIGTELFEVAPRPVALSLANGLCWISNFLVGFSFPMLLMTLGSWVFGVFAINCFMLFLFTKYYLPETKGRLTTEVAEVISHGLKSKIKSEPHEMECTKQTDQKVQINR